MFNFNEAMPDFFAQFKFKRGLFRREQVRAAVFALDDYGCVMKTDKLFEPGDTLVVDLVLEMPIDDIRADGINGLVTERQKHCSNFYYSVDFSQLNGGSNAEYVGKLRRIRDMAGKKQSLKSRRSTGPSANLNQTA